MGSHSNVSDLEEWKNEAIPCVYTRQVDKQIIVKSLAAFIYQEQKCFQTILNIQAFKPERINPSSSSSYKHPLLMTNELEGKKRAWSGSEVLSC